MNFGDEGMKKIVIVIFMMSSIVVSSYSMALEIGQMISTKSLFVSTPNAVTDIILTEGETYTLETVVLCPLKDKKIHVESLNGFSVDQVKSLISRFALKFANKKKPMPAENWFALIGKIQGTDELFLLGSQRTFTAKNSGVLMVFVNDYPKFYDNNSGSYKIHITRTQ